MARVSGPPEAGAPDVSPPADTAVDESADMAVDVTTSAAGETSAVEAAIETAIETPAETAAQIAAQVAAHIAAQMAAEAPAHPSAQWPAGGPGRQPPENTVDSLNAVTADLKAALGLTAVVRGPETGGDVPMLPRDPGEPPPESRLAPPTATARLDLSGLETLRRLAGADPERARQALCAALAGGNYDPRALPAVRAMLLGMARMMIAHGVDMDMLADSIIEAMQE